MTVHFTTTVASFRVNGKQEPTVRRSFSRTPRSADFLITMEPLNCTRKLDTMGRVMIPIRLREQYGFEIGQEVPFYLHEIGTHKYLCIPCPGATDSRILDAIDLLEANGYNVESEEI